MTTAYRNEFGWAAAWSNGSPTPCILIHTIGHTRAIPMEHIGEVWKREGETTQQGWKRAYRKGCRLIRVRVSAWGQP